MVPSAIPCEFYVRSKCYSFLETTMSQEQKKYTVHFFRTEVYFTDQNRTDPKYRKKLITQDWQLQMHYL